LAVSKVAFAPPEEDRRQEAKLKERKSIAVHIMTAKNLYLDGIAIFLLAKYLCVTLEN